uniref:non-specific protein-tyrosine kinase n=1 Tax=Cyanothece sp. (strain PCC 7425 / ATCC 29141) TaxID=395961 RepID=B8HLI5_CYAP4
MNPELPELSANSVNSGLVKEEYSQIIPPSYYRPQEKGTLGLKDFLGIARRRWLLILGVASSVFTLTAVWTLTRTPIYTTSFEILVKPIESSPELAEGSPGSNRLLYEAGKASNHSTLIEVLRTPRVLQAAADTLQTKYPQLTVTNVSNRTWIEQLPGTDILEVSYTDTDPVRALAVAQELGKTYVSYGDSLRKSSITQGITFVQRQLPTLQARVQQLQNELQNFQQQHTLVDPGSRGQSLSAALDDVQAKQQETITALAETQATYSALRSQLGNIPPSEAIAASNLSAAPRYQALLARLQEIETKIAEASATYQPDSPQMQVLLENRANLLPLLQREARQLLGGQPMPRNQGNSFGVSQELNTKLVETANTLQMLQTRDRALKTAEASLRQQFQLVPVLSRQYIDLQRQLKIATESLERFLATRETLEIEAAQKAQPWQLMSNPVLPGTPVSPDIPRNLSLGLLGALLLGAGAALLAEKMHDVFHSHEDLRRELALPVLGMIPFNPKSRNKTAQVLGGITDSKLTNSFQSRSFMESFRSLYSNLRLLGTDSPIRSLVLSSALPADGKSTTSYNMALAAAVMGQRVLLVDADLRRPTVHTRLELPNLQGLSNAITANLPLTQVIQQSSLEENLFIMTAGQIPPDPTRLLASGRMRELMKELEANFDLVIYDAPPVVGFADSVLLSSNTDGCLLVVGLGQTEKAALQQALDYLKVSNTPILGVIANSLKPYTNDQAFNKQYYYRYYIDQEMERDEEPEPELRIPS